MGVVRDPREDGRWVASTAFEWVKAVWRAFGGGSGLAHVIWFVIFSEYKTYTCALQDLRRGERYSASRIAECLEKNDAVISFPSYYAA
jgi:hypothetical protein